MSLRARKSDILAFILGALALGTIMVYSFGGREKFSRHESFLLYFDGTVNGLGPGSPVCFEGVPIGSVQAVRLGFRPGSTDRRVPVVIQLNADRMQRQLGMLDDLADPATLAAEVRRGLRAQLQTYRYATGSMYVELEFHSHEQVPAISPSIDDLPEIPTMPSSAMAGLQKIQNLSLWLANHDLRVEINQVGADVDSLTTKVSVVPYAEYHQKVVDTLAPLANFNLGAWQRNFTGFLARLDKYHGSIALANDQFTTSAQDFVGMNQQARAQLLDADAALARARSDLLPDAPWLAHLTHNFEALSSDMANLTAKLNATEQQPDLLPKIPK